VTYLLTLSAAIAVGAGLVAFLTPIVWLDRHRAQRRARFFAQLPEAISMLATAIRSGRTLRQAFHRVAAAASDPVASAFLEVSRGAERDFPRLAVSRLLERYPGEELELLAAALAVHPQASASLPDLLERVAHALRARRDAASGAKRHRRLGYAVVAASVATAAAVALLVPAPFPFDVYGWVALVLACSFVAALALIGDLGQSDA
jgi:tight adherence protein B